MKGIGISRIAVGNEGERLFRASRACGFLHRDGGRQGTARIGHVISENLATGFGEEEKHVGMFAADFDIGFIAGEMLIQYTFESEIVLMAVKCRGFGVIEHGLMGKGDAKELPEHECGFASANSKRDVEGENQPHQMRWLMNAAQVNAGRRGCGVVEMFFGVMMLAILIMQFELRQALWLQFLLVG